MPLETFPCIAVATDFIIPTEIPAMFSHYCPAPGLVTLPTIFHILS